MKPCVIEIQDNVPVGLHICKDDKQAQELFVEIVQENTDLTEGEAKRAIDGGVVEIGDGSVCLYQGHEL